MDETICRCPWGNHSSLEQAYHDHVWGIPVHDDHQLFKTLMLEGMQAGLSWLTVLKKLPALEAAFDDFRPEKLIHYDQAKEAALLANPGIIRNRLKVKAAAKNARAYFRLCETYGSLNQFLWRFVNFTPVVNHFHTQEEVPARTPLSDDISKALKQQGFTFVGSTIVYAFLQAVGMVNDHLVGCAFRRVDGEAHAQPA